MVSILVVEDDNMVRLLTKTKLCALYQIYEAADGQEALQVLDHTHVDLLIVDIRMPYMNGYELVRELRQAGDQTPIIMLTAMNSLYFLRNSRKYILHTSNYLYVWHTAYLY